MPNKKQRNKKTNHGGARPGAGRKPGSQPRVCATCAVLLKQLEAAEKREQALMKQLSKSSDQIGMVIQSKFETVRISGQELPEPTGSVMPVDALTDVTAVSDESFIDQVSKVTH